MSREKLKVGIIGTGAKARGGHIPGFSRSEYSQVTAVCDASMERAQKVVQDLSLGDVDIYADYRELLKTNVDIVTVGVPNYLHAEVAVAAAKAGKHIFCEKPMAITVKDAEAIIEATKENGVFLTVNFSFRFHPKFKRIRRALDEDMIGEVFHLRVHRSGSPPPLGTWFVSKKAGGGILNDLGPHSLDLMHWYLGNPRAICGFVATRTPGIDADDNVTAIAEFENGATGVIELSWTTDPGRFIVEVYGTKGQIIYEPSESNNLRVVKAGTREVVLLEDDPAPLNEYATFAKAVFEGVEPPISGIDGLNVVRTTEAIFHVARGLRLS